MVFCTDPVLVADVEYRAWTEDNRFRHPSFKGVTKRKPKTKLWRARPRGDLQGSRGEAT
ncbi:hypothetical protein [Ensifer sp. LBL]|uniref:ATP dependent DNA ligase n=1 Tax=Ensifer sp. LBL TaxID=2991056 RepID=UPI003D224A63